MERWIAITHAPNQGVSYIKTEGGEHVAYALKHDDAQMASAAPELLDIAERWLNSGYTFGPDLRRDTLAAITKARGETDQEVSDG